MNFDELRRYSQARVGLGNVGHGLSTKEWLKFSYDHAGATDAVMQAWDPTLHAPSFDTLGLEYLELCSQAKNREEYLARPDLGRLLHDSSKKALKRLKLDAAELVIVATNGLSSLALEKHLDALLTLLIQNFASAGIHSYKKVFLIQNARVALIDEIGEILRPRIALIIVGERPGLSAPDSLGIYLTYKPVHGRRDAERNVISNIRPPHGLSYEEAAHKTVYLVQECLRLKLSGIGLNEEGFRGKNLEK